jgi:hypothetical protein
MFPKETVAGKFDKLTDIRLWLPSVKMNICHSFHIFIQYYSTLLKIKNSNPALSANTPCKKK